MNNGVITKQERVDIDVRTERGTGRPHLSMRFPPSFYAKEPTEQGEIFVKSVEIAFEKFFEHLLAMRKAGG